MMIEEFISRTGYRPTFEEYKVIEKAYYDFDGDKNEFCEYWLIYHWAREQVFSAVNDRLQKKFRQEGDTKRVAVLAHYLNLLGEILY